MDNKPKINAFCAAGCAWDTLHKEDFEKSVTYIPVNANDSGSYSMTRGKEYKIFASKNEAGNFDCSVIVHYQDVTSASYIQVDLMADITNNDEYAESFVFRFLDMYTENNYMQGKILTIVYEIAGTRYKKEITDPLGYELMPQTMYCKVIGATKVLLYNDDATITGEKGKSAYDIWLEQGNTGTEADFIASLYGKSYDISLEGTVLTIKALT